MKKRFLLFCCIIVNALLITTSVYGQTDYFADNGYVKPFDVTYPHPNSHYHNGVTYIAYQGSNENGGNNDPSVCSYNHITGEWRGPVRIGNNTLPNDDYHGKPSIVVDDLGYIHVVFGGHGGTIDLAGYNEFGGYSDGEFKHLRSNSPEDIGTGTSDWTRLNSAPGGGNTGEISVYGTYPQFLKVPNGDIYFFYRHGSHQSDWTYQKSTDNGNTWSDEVVFLDGGLIETWYAWLTVNGNRIDCAYNYHPGGSGDDRQDIYYMYLDTSNDTWYNVQGSDLSSKIPMNLSRSKKKTKVKNTNPDNYEVDDIVVRTDPNGIPHIAFRYYNDQAYHMMWDGSDWTTYVNITTDDAIKEDKFDIMPISSTEVKVLIRRKDASGTKIAWWTMDPTSSYRNEDEVVITEGNTEYFFASIPEFYHDDAKVMFFEKTGNDMVKIFMHGDSGLLTRGGAISGLNSTNQLTSLEIDTNQENNMDLIVYPNPAKDYVTVDLKTENIQSLQLFDMNGRLIKTESAINNSRIKVNIQDVSSGMYLIKVQGESKSKLSKVLIN
ncbi:BNR-4 repeat-containing protein [Marinifilum caeruleilacunae]|uniref:T9SS type A sorting domain-containing protein n=1 Tax=Marinifilum caeruleilacunae TaxID=2499076 RepID=A0ABX1WYV5_9BACT|nr:BNR-4 repeat-containing protein [Marinifilum caeruleilacunae]NOU61286.1 T9SS type A sorting domain-containing protein [Marinifilum caeruleilacunae]